MNLKKRKQWISRSETYARVYFNLMKKEKKMPTQKFSCTTCGKKLKQNVWYHEFNGELFCSDNCLTQEYPGLFNYFMEKAKTK